KLDERLQKIGSARNPDEYVAPTVLESTDRPCEAQRLEGAQECVPRWSVPVPAPQLPGDSSGGPSQTATRETKGECRTVRRLECGESMLLARPFEARAPIDIVCGP